MICTQPAILDYRSDLAASCVDLAGVQHKTGRPDDAAASFRTALEVREKLIQDNGKLTVATRWGTLVTRETLVPDNPMLNKYRDDVAANYADLGPVEREMGRGADAESAFRKAIEIREKLLRDHPTVTHYQAGLARSYANLGVAQLASARPADAEVSHRKAIAIREKLVQDNPTRADYQQELAISYRDLENARRGGSSTP